jgi:tRNA-dihydrouridine synthase 3
VAEKKSHLDAHSLRVKPEFILQQRAECLSALPEVARENEEQGNTKKSRGRNKKRPRDFKPENKLCSFALQAQECPYEDCKFSHDLKEAASTRPPDIVQVQDGCPNYNVKGFCEYGVRCRVGANHLNLATGESFVNPEVAPPPPVMNVLSRELQAQLKRNKYPFKCKRFNAKQKKSTEKTGEEKNDSSADVQMETDGVSDPSRGATTTTTTDYSPLPEKRKLIDFRNKVYVAPLTTVGNLPFRRIMKRFGADITCGEMAVATHLLGGKQPEWALLKRHPEEDVFGVQIAAGYPDQYTRVCEVLEATATVDFVDLNLGCPLDMICKKGAGAFLMKRSNKLRECLEGITSALSCPITIKMRTGWDEGHPFAHKLVPEIQSWGIDGISAIMIHGRSRLQRYSRYADWDYISQVAMSQSDKMDKIPLIGNGDIFSYQDYEEKVAREGVEATAMLARGALIKPWLPTEIKERRDWDISASERLDILKDFVKFGLEHWGSDQMGVNLTRRFLLEWLSFLYRYVPVGLLEVLPQQMNQRPPPFMCGRSDLETLMLSDHCADWIRITEMLLGPVPEGFDFEPKHKANGYK